jgi:hypothetical protein
MRHFVGFSAAIATLTSSVGVASAKAGLVTFSGGLYAPGAHLSGTVGAAVTVTAVAVAADDYAGAAAGAHVASWGWLHRQIGPTGLGWTKPDVS